MAIVRHGIGVAFMRVTPPGDGGFETVEDWTDLRARVRRLSQSHLSSLDEFHYKGLRLPADSAHRRELGRLTQSRVSLRGFFRYRLEDVPLRPDSRRVEPVAPSGHHEVGAHARIRTTSTTAAVRSILRNRNVPFRNLMLEDLIFDLFMDLCRGHLGPAGLPAWNPHASAQVLDLFARLRPLVTDRLGPGGLDSDFANRYWLGSDAIVRLRSRHVTDSDNADNGEVPAPEVIGPQWLATSQSSLDLQACTPAEIAEAVAPLWVELVSRALRGCLYERRERFDRVLAQLQTVREEVERVEQGMASKERIGDRRSQSIEIGALVGLSEGLQRNRKRLLEILRTLVGGLPVLAVGPLAELWQEEPPADPSQQPSAGKSVFDEQLPTQWLLDDEHAKLMVTHLSAPGPFEAAAMRTLSESPSVSQVDFLINAVAHQVARLPVDTSWRDQFHLAALLAIDAGMMITTAHLCSEVSQRSRHESRPSRAGLVVRPAEPSALHQSRDELETELQWVEYPDRGCVAYWTLSAFSNAEQAIRFSRAIESVAGSPPQPTPSPEVALTEGVGASRDNQVQQVEAIVRPLAADVCEVSMSCLLEQIALFSARDRSADFFELGFHLCVVARFGRERVTTDVLSTALQCLFSAMSPVGIWERGFPAWATPNGGEWHCWTFELLSAIFEAFREEPDLLRPYIAAIDRAIGWLERNQLRLGTLTADGPRSWCGGQRSGIMRTGSRRPLREIPEGWATAEVYTFLHLADTYVTDEINLRTVRKYGGRVAELPRPEALTRLLGDVKNLEGTRVPLQDEIKLFADEMRTNAGYLRPYSLAAYGSSSGQDRSWMFYGPPGTGKTTFAESTARYLGWPFIALSSSDFTAGGTQSVTERTTAIFRDLARLEDVVVLFDEMEEFIHDRSADASYIQRIWTNAFLPSFQRLHDETPVVFFVATNHLDRVDAAIRRPGRFDFVVHIPIPSTDRKIWQLEQELKRRPSRVLLRVITGCRHLIANENREQFQISEVDADGETREASRRVNYDRWFEALNRSEMLAYVERVRQRVTGEFEERVRQGAIEEADADDFVRRTLIDAAKLITPQDFSDTNEPNRLPSDRLPPPAESTSRSESVGS